MQTSNERKAEMYGMILAIENDIIENIYSRIEVEDIPETIRDRSIQSSTGNIVKSILQGLDFQAYIEICNANIIKLVINKTMKDFLNKELKEIIPIRNRVMHPRPLGIMDYHKVKGLFEEIINVFPGFEWKNIYSIKKIITERPQDLPLPPSNVKKSESIIENLPLSVDFEETDFIGRRREIGEIKAILQKPNVHVLSIIGDGGVGKTAIALKFLYDMLDDENCNYNFILWVSLKTNELNNYEFKKIQSSIKTIGEMYEKLGDFVGATEIDNIPDYLVELSKEFNMLLVLDNLETINTGELQDFLDRFTECGKVLITSRISLGEMEKRYRLEGLCASDVYEYFTVLLDLYGLEGIYCKREIENIATNELYSNPLAIKWFIRCLYNGQSTDEILKNKKEIANFCMSNVYDKLSDLAKEVLNMLLLSKSILPVAELMYYIDNSIENYMSINYAINELLRTNFINDQSLRNNRELIITDFAKEFLKINCTMDSDFISKYRVKESQLRAFSQRQLQSKHKSFYAMNEFNITDTNDMPKIISAYYLEKALGVEKDNIDLAFSYVDFAKKLSLNNYQCNKIAAYPYGTTSQEKAKDEYEFALKLCESKEDEITILILYAGFQLRCNDYYGALKHLENAESILGKETNNYVLFEKAKILGCLNDFSKANKELNKLDFSLLDIKEENIYFTRKADLLKRESELLDQRDLEKKFGLLKEAYRILLLSQEYDKEIYRYFSALLRYFSYMYYYLPSMEIVIDILDNFYTKIRTHSDFKVFKEIITSKFDVVDKSIQNRIKKYLVDTEEIIESLKQNEGVVYHLDRTRNFGFFKNKENMKGVYFRIEENIADIEIGNIVQYSNYMITAKNSMAKIDYIVE